MKIRSYQKLDWFLHHSLIIQQLDSPGRRLAWRSRGGGSALPSGGSVGVDFPELKPMGWAQCPKNLWVVGLLVKKWGNGIFPYPNLLYDKGINQQNGLLYNSRGWNEISLPQLYMIDNRDDWSWFIRIPPCFRHNWCQFSDSEWINGGVSKNLPPWQLCWWPFWDT